VSSGAASSRTVLRENPRAWLFLGVCPAIAVSARVVDALWMSAGVMFVLVVSGLALALLAREQSGPAGKPESLDPGDSAGAWLRALLVTSFITAAFEAGLLAVAPAASASLGIYAPLIAVNCLVLGRGVPGPARRTIGSAVLAAAGRGIGFAAALVLIALARETLGAGTITLFPVGAFGGTIDLPFLVEQPVRALGMAGGGLLCLGYLAGAARAISQRAAGKVPERGDG
jgi:electron transport complex protein RnfE